MHLCILNVNEVIFCLFELVLLVIVITRKPRDPFCGPPAHSTKHKSDQCKNSKGHLNVFS